MKAPQSPRSRQLWIAVITVSVAMWGGQVAFGVRGRIPAWVGVVATIAWFSLFLTYVASRLNDSWAHEARDRRAAARRSTYSKP